MKFSSVLVILVLWGTALFAHDDRALALDDKCGFDPVVAAHTFDILGHAWGYGYDTLLVDLQKWQQSPYVNIDSIGASTQNRAIWLVTITDSLESVTPRVRISIHARTHPGEVQSTWVTNELIEILLSETELGRRLRQNCIFNIVPMYNPDGVELGYARENANGVDIESNWSATNPEKEVLVLRQLFEKNMTELNPIEIALNMHSAYICKRYFVFHDAVGTSQEYENLERDFIGAIHDQWPEEIEPWDYRITWKTGTPLVYPESWFWLKHGANVVALTYEDKNCDSAQDFDLAAAAITAGIADYLQLPLDPASVLENEISRITKNKIIVYPNPIQANGVFHVFYNGVNSAQKIELFDVLGHTVYTFQIYAGASASYSMPTTASGSYFLKFTSENSQHAVPVTVLH
ncbi:MAG: T9SS C-terminal target domain-containing protein [Calditrichaeota bacterium]|nr:MAG: T9SS C-terminal target domain-containing protein [Calditrichota bacterium]